MEYHILITLIVTLETEMCESSHFAVLQDYCLFRWFLFSSKLIFKKEDPITLTSPNTFILPVSAYSTTRDNRYANTCNRKWHLYCSYYKSIRITILSGVSSKKLMGLSKIKIALNLWLSLKTAIILNLLSLLIIWYHMHIW